MLCFKYNNSLRNYHIISQWSLWNTDLLGINPGIFSNNIIVCNGNNIE